MPRGPATFRGPAGPGRAHSQHCQLMKIYIGPVTALYERARDRSAQGPGFSLGGPELTLVGQFDVKKLNPDASVPRMAWLDHAVYVTYDNLRSVRVFKDESPFTELSPIHIEDLVMPDSMVACAWMHKIYIGVSQESIIWKIDCTNNTSVIKLPIDLMGTPVHLSITTDNNLLAVVVRFCSVQQVGDELHFEVDALDNLVYNAGGTRAFHYLEIHRQTDHARVGMIRLPEDMEKVGCVVQSTDSNFIISYQRNIKSSEFFISALSSNGENIIWTMVTAFFTIHSQSNFYPYYFIIDQEGDGDIFLAAKCENRVFVYEPSRDEIQQDLCPGISIE